MSGDQEGLRKGEGNTSHDIQWKGEHWGKKRGKKQQRQKHPSKSNLFKLINFLWKEKKGGRD